MKSSCKLTIAMLLVAASAPLLQGQISLGVRAGVNLATAELETRTNGNWDTEWQDYGYGLSAGLLVEIPVLDHFAVQPELNYIRKGYQNDVLGQKFKTTLDYCEVPVFFKGTFGHGPVQFDALLGPSIGYAFAGRFKSGDTETDIDFDRDEINPLDFGLNAGLGLRLHAGPGALFLDGRFGWGLSNLDDSSNSDDYNWHNRGINLGLGYLLPLNR